jgi:hypothetical protein
MNQKKKEKNKIRIRRNTLLTSGKSRDKRIKTVCLLEYWPVPYQTDGYQTASSA